MCCRTRNFYRGDFGAMTKLEKRRPWAKWYWGDWRKDARLRRCSFAARGLWADMLSLMGGECEPFGCLLMEGQPLEAEDLAGLLGGSENAVGPRLTRVREALRKILHADPPILRGTIPACPGRSQAREEGSIIRMERTLQKRIGEILSDDPKE